MQRAVDLLLEDGRVRDILSRDTAMTSRAPGLLGAAIDAPVRCGVICDGIHAAWEMPRIAMRARPERDLSFAVRDAMATVGGPDRFEL